MKKKKKEKGGDDDDDAEDDNDVEAQTCKVPICQVSLLYKN